MKHRGAKSIMTQIKHLGKDWNEWFGFLQGIQLKHDRPINRF
jgi:hypothetical protein